MISAPKSFVQMNSNIFAFENNTQMFSRSIAIECLISLHGENRRRNIFGIEKLLEQNFHLKRLVLFWSFSHERILDISGCLFLLPIYWIRGKNWHWTIHKRIVWLMNIVVCVFSTNVVQSNLGGCLLGSVQSTKEEKTQASSCALASSTNSSCTNTKS